MPSEPVLPADSDCHLRMVTEIFVEAIEADSHEPIRDVASTFGVSLATATKWVKRARRRGLMPDALTLLDMWPHMRP